jgi:hypothetical protein
MYEVGSMQDEIQRVGQFHLHMYLTQQSLPVPEDHQAGNTPSDWHVTAV